MNFDEEIAKYLIGKRILIGITYLNGDGELESQKQLYGTVNSAAEDEGILINLEGEDEGDVWNMPPDTSAVSKADPGEYKLRGSNDVVVNPDYLCTWEVHRSDETNET